MAKVEKRSEKNMEFIIFQRMVVFLHTTYVIRRRKEVVFVKNLYNMLVLLFIKY